MPRGARRMITAARAGPLAAVTRRVDRPRWVACIAFVAGAVVAGARILVAGHGNIASFIVVGAVHVRSRVPSGIPITSGQGYDGQFYYRIALAPFNFHHTAFGIQMDTLSRFERIAYPVLAWLAAAGRSPLVPWSLVIVNVLGLGALGALGAVVARDAGSTFVLGTPASGLLRVRVGLVSRSRRDRDRDLRRGRSRGPASGPPCLGRSRPSVWAC